MTDLGLTHARGALPRLEYAGSPARVARTTDRLRLLRRLLGVADALAAISAATALALTDVTFAAAASLVLVAPAWIVLAKLFGLYDRDQRALRHLAADELQPLFLWALTCTGLLAIFLEAFPTGRLEPTVLVLYWLTLFGAAVLVRSGARLLWRRITPPARTIILGSGPLAAAALRKLELFRDIHVDVLGSRAELAPHELESFCERLDDVDRVIVAYDRPDDALLARLTRSCKQHRTRLSVIPPVASMFGGAVALTRVAELPVLEHDTSGIARSTYVLKRAMDIAASAVGLVLLSPVMAAIGLALHVSSSGPAVFSQLRAGQHGKPFRMLKFRTMVPDAEARLADLVCVDELPEPVFKLRDDPRVTRLGRILRRTSLDELPQLLNVLRGEMSLVGPRPEQLDLVERYSPGQRIRLEVKPGITGPMQVYGRGELSLDERLAVEREYIENLSLGRDVQILALTASAVLTGRGAL